MNQDKYTEEALASLSEAQQIAALNYHQEVTTKHLLLALIKEDGIASQVLRQLQADPENLKKRLEAMLRGLPAVRGHESLHMNTAMIRVLARAEQLAGGSGGSAKVGPEHLLAAVVEDGESDVVSLCREFGLNRSRVLQAAGEIRQAGGGADSGDNPLAKYGRDLTELARAGKLDPVIGRDEEIRRVVEICLLYTSPSPRD